MIGHMKALRQEDEIVHQIGKQEVKLSLSTDTMTLLFKDPKGIQNTPLRSYFKTSVKQDKTKIKMQKSIAFRHVNNKLAKEEIIKENHIHNSFKSKVPKNKPKKVGKSPTMKNSMHTQNNKYVNITENMLEA